MHVRREIRCNEAFVSSASYGVEESFIVTSLPVFSPFQKHGEPLCSCFCESGDIFCYGVSRNIV